MSKACISGAIALPSEFTSLADLFSLGANTLYKGAVVFPADNSEDAFIKATCPGAADVTVSPGQYHEYAAVDLSTIFVKGTSSDTVVLVGEHIRESVTFPE
jgi:hypothetical protein